MDRYSRIDGLEEARNDVDLNVVDLNVVLAQRMDCVKQLLVPVSRKRNDYSIDVVPADDVVQVRRLAEQLEIAQVWASLFRATVDEPDQVDPVLRML